MVNKIRAQRCLQMNLKKRLSGKSKKLFRECKWKRNRVNNDARIYIFNTVRSPLVALSLETKKSIAMSMSILFVGLFKWVQVIQNPTIYESHLSDDKVWRDNSKKIDTFLWMYIQITQISKVSNVPQNHNIYESHYSMSKNDGITAKKSTPFFTFFFQPNTN